MGMPVGYMMGVSELEFTAYGAEKQGFTILYGLGIPGSYGLSSIVGPNYSEFGFVMIIGTNYYFHGPAKGPYASVKMAMGLGLRSDPEHPHRLLAIQSDNLTMLSVAGGYRHVLDNHIELSAELGLAAGKPPFANASVGPAFSVGVGLQF